MAEVWFALAKDAVALVGGVCLTLNVLLPIATLALQFVVIDAPKLLARWRARRQQQEVLKQLALRLERLEMQCAQSTTRPSRRRLKQVDDDAEDAKQSLLSQAEATERSESEASQQQRRQHRHRLSMYSTVKKLSRVRARDDDG